MPRSASGDSLINQQQQQQQRQQQEQIQPLMTQQQRELFLAQRAHQQQSMAGPSDVSVRPPLPTQSNLPGQPQGQSPRQPLSHVQQRQNFLKTFLGYFQNTGQQPPPAIFDNGEREGAFKIGDGWMDVIDLLMAVMKAGGILNVSPPFYRVFFSIILIIYFYRQCNSQQTVQHGAIFYQPRTFPRLFLTPSPLPNLPIPILMLLLQ